MYKKLLSVFILIIFGKQVFAQQNTIQIQFQVLDSISKEGVVNALVSVDGKAIAYSDYNGKVDEKFTYPLKASDLKIKVSALGYKSFEFSMSKAGVSSVPGPIMLCKETKGLNTIVVSGSKYAKNIAEETVSMEVVKPSFIEKNNFTALDEALNKVPGVDVVDGQANIRGGGGWSYGAGSRVLVMIDDMPLITADAGDVKWDFLPIENCEQVEILKGAASSLYGSSAMNGVIHFRTAYAKSKPKTHISYYSGWNGDAPIPAAQWWGETAPVFTGINFFHSEKKGNLDWVIGGAGYTDWNRSYLLGDFNTRARINANLRYHVKEVKGMTIGVNMNNQISKGATFFYWLNDSAGMYIPYGGIDPATTTVSYGGTRRLNVDPYLTWTDEHGLSINLRTRFFRSNNVNSVNQSSLADLYYTEQQVQKRFPFGLNVTGGAVHTYSKVKADLFGQHDGNNMAVYAQAEQKIGKLWLSAGVRNEWFRIDLTTATSKPVYRTGFNYQIAQATYLRGSWGMGYRFPSIGEKFVRTRVGGVNVLPNPNLKAESGKSYEIGIKQGLKIQKWQGYFDVAAFSTTYNNMDEFQFNMYYSGYDPRHPELTPLDSFIYYLGFKMINVSQARINGAEATLVGQGEIGKVNFNVMAGYTYLQPLEMKWDSARKVTYSDTSSNFLKYRVRHTAKIDIEASYKKFTLGTGFRYMSRTVNIDAIFENKDLFPIGVAKFRQAHLDGTYLWDARLFYQLNSHIRLGFVAKNLLNVVYTERPAFAMPPRNYTIQATFDF
ncbi:MAG: TonB-dependent receptor [Chitinophagales bacterium]|nr:TonB-dependent receptor [Chitinophagales bacterium]